MKLTRKPSPRYGEYLRKLTCDHWEVVGESGNDKVIIRCKSNGVTTTYGTHDGGNDWNGPRNMAAEITKACGCPLVEARGRKRSRKAIRMAGFTNTRAHPAADAIAAELAQLRAEWDEIETYLVAAVTIGRRPDDALEKAERRQEIAERLRDLYQPLPPSAFPLGA